MAVRFAQLSEGYPVPPRHLEAHCYRGLDKAAARMYIRLCGVCLAVVPVGIAAVEQPSIAKSYSDGAVAAGVAWKRDEDDFSVADLEWRGSLEAEPLEASGNMRLPSGPVQCVLWPIRAPLDQRSGVEVCVDLRRGRMDNCLREGGQSTSVIHVQMGEEDVSHVSRAVS